MHRSVLLKRLLIICVLSTSGITCFNSCFNSCFNLGPRALKTSVSSFTLSLTPDSLPDSLPDSSSSITTSLLNSPSQPLSSLLPNLKTLEASYSPTPQSRSDLLGDYEVLRTFNPSSPDKNSNAAGGKWVKESGVTSRIFKLQGLYQNLILENSSTSAVNLVLLSILSRFICVAVVLKGECTFLSEEDREEIVEKRKTDGGLTSNTVRAEFGSPMLRISLFGFKSFLGITAVIGPTSKVILDASYVDDELRVGKGASGVRFLLKRCVEGEEKDVWRRVVGSKFVVRKRGMISSMMLFGGAMLLRGGKFGKVFGLSLLTLAAAIVKSTGGIEEGEQEEV